MKIIRPTAVLDSGVGAFSRASTATYYDSAKVLKTAAVDIPRIGYDPATGTLVGPVIESAATNLLTYSEYWDNVAWVKTACTVGPSTQPALDGTLTADVIAWTGLGNIDRPLTLSGTGTYTFSCFIHTSSTCTSLSVVIYWLGSVTQAAYVTLNPTTGVFISQGSTAGATIIGYTITNVGNGWYRVSVSGTGTNSNNTIVQSQLYNNIASSCKAVVWGGQLETGSTVTSYIPSVETWTGRASTATYINSAGLIAIQSSGVARSSYNPLNLTLAPRLILENAATNLLVYSEYFDNAAWSFADVTKSSNAITAPDGSVTADTLVSTITGGTNTAYANQLTTVSASTTYTFSVYVKQGTSPTSTVNFYRASPYSAVTGTITWGTTPSYVTVGGDLLGGTLTDVGGGWYRATLTMSSGTATQMVSRVYVRDQGSSNVTGHTVSVWGAQLEAGSTATSYMPSTETWTGRASVATYFGSNGLIQTAASGVQRLNYNPTNLTVAPKLLLEAAATNLLLRSQEFDNAAWTKDTTTITANSIAAPDGTVSADTQTTSGSGGSNTGWTQSAIITVSTSTTYTASRYVKQGNTATSIYSLARVSPYSVIFATITWGATPSVVGSGADLLGSSITAAGNGWWRVSLTMSSATATQMAERLYTRDFSTSVQSGDTVYTWGAQLEAGAFATSYIQTVGASASRLADTSTSGQTARVADTSSSVTSTRAADVEGAGSFSRTTTATYFDVDGVMQTAAINVPRIGYNPVTHAHEGLILEAAATNLLLRSQEFDNASWVKARTTVTADAISGPDNTSTADKLIEDTANNTHLAEQVVATVSGTIYTLSVFVKAAGRTKVNLSVYTNAATSTNFDLSAVTASNVLGTITDIGGGWFRCTHTHTSGFTGSGYFDVYLLNASTVSSYTGDGTSGIYVWGAQLETGSTATSYIPTTSAQVTRAADIITGTGFIYSNLPEGGGTLLTKPETLATQSVTVSATPYTISFTGTGSIVLSGTGSGSLVGTGASNRVSLTFTPTAGTLTITVTGSVTLAQLELGSTLSPYRNETEWNAATNYTVGQQVIRTTSATHKIYENLSAGVDSTFPELLPARWLEVAPTNRWGVFDSQVGTVSTALNSITYLLKPGRINSIAMLEADAALVTLSLVLPTGQVIYASSVDLNAGTTVGDWYQYFYEPIYQQDSLVVTNLLDTALLNIPSYAGATLAITLSKPSGTVSCGIIVVGLSADLGSTQRAPSIGIIDYSTKVVDAFGNFTITKRKYSKRMNVKLAVPSNTVDATSRVISQYRSTPLVWVGAENLYTSLIVYGFYRDFDITIDNHIMSTCDIQIEGLT